MVFWSHFREIWHQTAIHDWEWLLPIVTYLHTIIFSIIYYRIFRFYLKNICFFHKLISNRCSQGYSMYMIHMWYIAYCTTIKFTSSTSRECHPFFEWTTWTTSSCGALQLVRSRDTPPAFILTCAKYQVIKVCVFLLKWADSNHNQMLKTNHFWYLSYVW